MKAIVNTRKDSPNIGRLGSLDQLLVQSEVLSALDSGVMITDRQGCILWVNQSFSDSIGYPAEAILGKTPKLFKSGNHDRTFYRRFWDTILCGETWRGEFVNRRRDGSLCIHAQTTTPMRRNAGSPITHFISINEDITNRKQTEEETCQIRAMETVRQLAAGTAHRFNNLLTVVQCNSELLLMQNGSLNPESRELVERTLIASHRMADLVGQLVGFSQSTALNLQALDLNRLVEEVLRVFRRGAHPNIEWKCDHCACLPPALADEGALSKVVSHVVINALDAMPRGGRLTLATEKIVVKPAENGDCPAVNPGEFVCLTVRDSGCGIVSEDLPRIFEPFFTTKEPGERSGLGLAFVHGVVKQHHGWTEVNSQPNRGSTFKIFLPALNA